MEDIIEKTYNWWYCDNFVHPAMENKVGLLHMGEPCVMVVIKDYEEALFEDYEQFSQHVERLNFLYPEERNKFNQEEILKDAYNFLALEEEAEESIDE